MIEFKGELSEKNKNYLLKNNIKIDITLKIIMIIFLIIPCLIIGIKYENSIIFILPFAIVSLSIILYISGGKDKLNAINDNLPIDIIIDKKNIIKDGIGPNGYAERNIEEIKKIIDIESAYQIIFYFPNKNIYFICQKDLIVNGTIEEFEQLFADKIVRAKKR